jgi:hypothetical protein
MAIYKEINKPGMAHVMFDDSAFAGVSEEEIKRREQRIKDVIVSLALKAQEKDSA